MVNKKKVLVTGLSGLVGTALRKDFEERYELSSFSRYGTDGIDSTHNFKGITIVVPKGNTVIANLNLRL